MVPQKIKDTLRYKKDAISIQKEKLLFQNGFLTGSQAFKCANENSDWDLLFHNEKDWDLNEHQNVFDGQGRIAYIPGEYRTWEFTSWYFKTKDEKYINIISFFEKEDYDVWVEATTIVLSLMRTSHIIRKGIKDKKMRVELFELLKKFIRNQE